ncbi:hypothetical protein CEXT_534411 [Caerostris extrusa]|uniref:Uncharacterized protein n=1 Tax=Caerostris extrusa TaxID=172846 RepID=A0AAV4XFG2_CAEEX|nr:hypothetical protein CEXT_534411 [Caerostris extrusa]
MQLPSLEATSDKPMFGTPKANIENLRYRKSHVSGRKLISEFSPTPPTHHSQRSDSGLNHRKAFFDSSKNPFLPQRGERVYLFPISCDGPCKSRQTVIAGQCRMCRLSVILGRGGVGVAQGVVQITRWRTRDPRSQIDAKRGARGIPGCTKWKAELLDVYLLPRFSFLLILRFTPGHSGKEKQ